MQEPTVFIVDDNPAFLDSLSILISSLGMKTKCFGSAEQFLEGFDPKAPGCLILDVRMPGLNGLELQEVLNEQPVHPPVIMLTGYAEAPIASRAIRQGAVEFLQKTVSEDELCDAIQRAISKDAVNRRAASSNN
jgi:two-component system, LuxR family, response regulator FixJ